MTAVPASFISRIFEKRASTSFGANPADGSSIRSTFGSSIKDFAKATICCSPPLSVPARSRSLGRRLGNIPTTWVARSRICASFIWDCVPEWSVRVHGIDSGDVRRVIAPIWRFSRTVSEGNVLFIWGTYARPWRTRSRGCFPVMSAPSNRTWPPEIRSSPKIVLTSVDFPAPFGPITATISFWSRSIETP